MSDTKSQNPAVAVSGLRIARVYAEALLNAATKLGQIGDVLAELDSLVDDVFAADPQLETLFSGAAVGRKVRRDAHQEGFFGRASEAFLSFLRSQRSRPARFDPLHSRRGPRDRRRTQEPPARAGAVGRDVARRRARVRWLDQIRSVFQMEPVLDLRVQPELLGGLKVRIRDVQVDATVRSYLDNMNQQILARSSHEIQSRRDRFRSANGN